MVLVFDGDVLFTTCCILIPREFIFYKPTLIYSKNLFKEGFVWLEGDVVESKYKKKREVLNLV